MRFLGLLLLVSLLLACDSGFSVVVLDGRHHLGGQQVDGWPDPEGPCLSESFDLDELPTLLPEEPGETRSLVLLFEYIGAVGTGTVTLNQVPVFTGVTGSDRLGDAIGDVIGGAISCELGSEDQCENPGSEGTSISRELMPDWLSVGSNLLTVCSDGADFLIEDGVEITERIEQEEQTEPTE